MAILDHISKDLRKQAEEGKATIIGGIVKPIPHDHTYHIIRGSSGKDGTPQWKCEFCPKTVEST